MQHNFLWNTLKKQTIWGKQRLLVWRHIFDGASSGVFHLFRKKQKEQAEAINIDKCSIGTM